MNAVVHYPATLPRLLDHGSPVTPTSGDVDALFRGAVRLLRGETIVSSTPRGERLEVRGTCVRLGGYEADFDSTHDALVHAYSLISNFNIAWRDFEGESAGRAGAL